MPSNPSRRWQPRSGGEQLGQFLPESHRVTLSDELDKAWVSRLLTVVRDLGGSRDLADLLQRIANAVVEMLGFEMTAFNLVEADGDLRVVAVAGPPGVEAMRDERAPRALFDELLATAEPWGSLRFFDHRLDHGQFDELPTYVVDRRGPEGAEFWHPLDSLFAPMYASDGQLLGILSVDRPESGRKPTAAQRMVLELFAAEGARAIEEHSRRAQLVDAEFLYRSAFQLMPLGVAILDRHGRLLDVNQAFSWLLGEKRSRLVGEPLTAALGEADAAPLIACAEALLSGESGPRAVEHALVRADGSRRWIRSRLTAVRGFVSGDRVVLQSEDVTTEREMMAELEELARNDALTGLPNRRAAVERIDEAIERRRPGEVVAVLFGDLDGFKSVNDTRGHLAGDHVLTLVGQSLRTALRDDDVLFRIGGDEFLALCERLRGLDTALAIGRRLIDALRGSDDPGVPAGVSLSVGIAYLDDTCAKRSALELVSAADHALYRAKREGRGRMAVADPIGGAEAPST